jgi:hypothetical protein
VMSSLKLGSRRRWVLRSVRWPFYAPGNIRQYTFSTRLHVPQTRSGHSENEQSIACAGTQTTITGVSNPLRSSVPINYDGRKTQIIRKGMES